MLHIGLMRYFRDRGRRYGRHKFLKTFPNSILTLMTRTTTFFRFLLPVLLLVTLWAACKKSDFQNPELADHNAEFAFPLFTTDLLLQDLLSQVLNDTLSNDTLAINPDGTMTLFYTGDVAEKKATDIFDFFADKFIPMSDSLENYPLALPDGVTIKQAKLKAGTLNFVINSTLSQTITGHFEITQMTKNGQVFQQPFTALPNQVWQSGPVDITGYELNTGSNDLTFKYFAYLPDGTRINIPPAGLLPAVLIPFAGLEFSYFEGYFGYSTYPLTRDTIEININQTDLNGNVQIKNPKITIRINNSWGFPTRGVVRFLSFIDKNGNEHKLKTHGVFLNDSLIDFPYPKLNEVGQTKFVDITLDETNSNIAEIFNSQPTRLVYELGGISNAGQDPNIIGFLTDSSKISLQLRVKLDLEGSAVNFGSDQLLDLNFGDYSELDTAKIQDAEFKLVTENGTPISARLQMYFLDANSTRIDSLFSNGPQDLLRAAPIDADGKATGTTNTVQFIPMTASRFDRIRQAKKAFLQTSFTTAENGTVPVKLIASNQATIKMGLKVRTK